MTEEGGVEGGGKSGYTHSTGHSCMGCARPMDVHCTMYSTYIHEKHVCLHLVK